jgi:S1/P1 Nuclease
LRPLQFVLHFVGDIHQPLRVITRTDPAIGHDDRGGNCVGILHGNAHTPIKPHGFWDTGLVVEGLGKDTNGAATKIMALLTPSNFQKWSGATPSDWANESYGIVKSKVYAGVVDHAPAETGHIFPLLKGGRTSVGPPTSTNSIRTTTGGPRALSRSNWRKPDCDSREFFESTR